MRRNIDVNLLLLNNRIYGLTKGQFSPTSARGFKSKSSPYGTTEDPFIPAELTFGARGTFFARSLDVALDIRRPERPEIADEYVKELPEFEFRLKVKAGLTGYAQIYGKYNTTSYDKLKLDMIYVENCSLLMDLKLLLLTLKVIFIKESTEGLDEGQITAMK